jgi:peptide/nickel transport system substrate-binding protein
VSTPFPSSNNALYATAGGANWNGTHDPAVDRALAAGSDATDRAAEVAAYNRADQLLWGDMTTLPLFQKPTYIAFKDTYANIGDNASQEGPFWNAETWGVKSLAK